MRDLPRWLVTNADAVVALAIAVVAGVAGLANAIPTPAISSAILVAIGALAVSLLRYHWQLEATEPHVRELLTRTAASLDTTVAKIDSIASLGDVLSSVRQTVEEAATIRVLLGDEITYALQEAYRVTNEWIFKGGTATFLRAVTLPECVEYARSERRPISFQLEILDPTDVELCESYATYFRSMVKSDEDERSWTARGTQDELYATILAACWQQQRYSLLRFRIALSSTMTSFRWDLTSDHLFITERGPRFPAMSISRGGFYYLYWRNELELSFLQARRVQLEQATNLSENPTVSEVRTLFDALMVQLPEPYSDDEVRDLITNAIQARNPYG